MADACSFRDASGAYSCTRVREAGDRCFFHLEHHAQHPPYEGFEERLRGLISASDGNWTGFVFPRSLYLEGLTISFPINLSHARLGALRLQSCTFQQTVSLSYSQSSGPVLAENCRFEKDVSCSGAQFSDEFVWTSIAQGTANFQAARFLGQVRILGQFNGPVSWSGAAFSDAAYFQGGWVIAVGVGKVDIKGTGHSITSRPLFSTDAVFESVDFRRPDRVRFAKVDMTLARVGGTDFRGVSLHDVVWPTIRGRRVIYDEIWDRKTKDVHAPMLAVLEASYRSIRIALEQGKDFSTASDFYIGEMHARRKQMHWLRRYLLSIEAIYGYLSGYGCNPLRAFSWLIVVLALHALVAGALLYGAGPHLPDPDLALRSIKRTLSLLPTLKLGTSNADELQGGWFAIDVIAWVWVVVQTALFVLALRSRIKRG
jgi:hypothetical protein